MALTFALALFAILSSGSILLAAKADKCESVDDLLFLNNQSHALCATADCFSFNEVAYCKCDLLRGDSISKSFDFGEDQNICTLNLQGRRNGYRASTFSFPEEIIYQDGKLASYTCPGEDDKDKYVDPGYTARGSYV